MPKKDFETIMRMKKTLIYFLLSNLIFLATCQKDQIVVTCNFAIIDFNVYKEQYFINIPIEFSNKSEYAESYVWDFGDGTLSTEKNPTHTYKKPGVYKIELTVKNENSSDSKNIIIEVYPDRFDLLTRVDSWRLIGKNQYGQKIELTSCERGLRLSLTKDFKYIVTSVDTTICNWSYEEKWYLGEDNTIYESAGIGSWYGRSFYLTDKILILKASHQYELIYEPE
jgi:hypothetical protein